MAFHRVIGFLKIAFQLFALFSGLYLGYLQAEVVKLEPARNQSLDSVARINSNYEKCVSANTLNDIFDPVFPPRCRRAETSQFSGDIRDYGSAVRARDKTLELVFALLIAGILALIATKIVFRLFELRRESGPTKLERLALRVGRSSKNAASTAAHVVDIAQGRTAECGQCAELVKPNAKICRHCNSLLAV